MFRELFTLLLKKRMKGELAAPLTPKSAKRNPGGYSISSNVEDYSTTQNENETPSSPVR